MNQPLQNEDDMIGAIKIKDGLFIGDEFASQVNISLYISIGFRICCCK